MNAPRTGRGAKDRQSTAAKLPIINSNKSPSQVSITLTSPPSFESEKSNETFNPKIQPTAEQMRIAQIINDGNKNDDPDIQNKIEQVMELTKKSRDEVQIALHDCDNDPERAALLLLEGIQDLEGKWELSVKKKKNRQAAGGRPSEETNGVEGPDNKEESGKSDSQVSGRKSRGGPPRMNRNWRNKENEKNERNAEEGRSRGGDKESRSRGRKAGRGSRSRGEPSNRTSAGGRSRTFQNKSLNNTAAAAATTSHFPPSIEMWSNSAADQPQPSTTMNVGNWSDFTAAASEDWGEDDWSGNLETTVYTPSSHTDSKAQPPASHYNGSPSYSTAVASDLQDSRPQPKVQRVRIPPPSKIPETAVEMPGDSVAGLEIQFGGLQFTGSLDFTATSSVAEPAPASYPVSSSLSSSSSIANTLSSSSSSAGLATSLYPAVTSSSTHPPPSILNKEPLLLSNSSQASSAAVPRPLAVSPLDGITPDISSFYSKSQKALHPTSSPAVGSYGPSPLYPASSSAATAVSNSYQPSSTSGAAGFASGYGSTAAVATAEFTPYSTSQPTKHTEQQVTCLQGTYSEPLGQSQQQHSTASVLKNSLPTASSSSAATGSAVSSKGYNPVPPTLVPPQYIMGQAPPPPSLSFYQQPVCNYEDIQSRLATLGYYDVPVAPGRDNLQYTTSAAVSVSTAAEVPKYPPTRGDGGDQPSSSQQTFPIPPGYGYYIHGGMMTTPHYPAPFFSVHQPSNAHGGAVSTTSQFQKPTAFGSHSFNSVSYDSLNAQSQDFLKGSFASSSQGKTVAGSCDLTAAGAMYNKGHNAMLAKQTFEKAASFQSNPHQYGMPTGNLGFIPVLPQHHSLMHLRQDGSAATAAAPSAAAQQKAKSQGYANAATTYWNT